MTTATTSRSLLSELLEMNSGLVGASTGFMEKIRCNWKAQIKEAARLSKAVVELSALSAPEFPVLIEYLKTHPRLPFEHVLVHGPAKELVEEFEATVTPMLEVLPKHVEGVVFHPETILRPDSLSKFGRRVILENMDPRKKDARTVDELSSFFSLLPEARFCLDVAHAQLNDPTLTLAHELLDAYRDRLAEVHLSSILRTGRHVPLTRRDLHQFEPVLARCVGVPWILEASLRS